MKQYENYPTESKCGATRRSAWPPTRSLTLRSVILGILIFALAISPGAAFALTGNGTPESPYKISNAEELAEFRDIVNNGSAGAHAKLTKNITLSSENWTPIGNDYYKDIVYRGTFDGCGFTISGLTMNGEYADYGLFGNIDGGTVKNLTLKDLSITVSSSNQNDDIYVGGIAGYIMGGIAENCSVTGESKISGVVNNDDSDVYVGGIFGAADGETTVENCSNTSTVNGDYAGGIVGYIDGKDIAINFCSNGGAVNAGPYGGGIVGYIYYDSEIALNNCLNYGNVKSRNAGGIAGTLVSASAAELSSCSNTGGVEANNAGYTVDVFAGGIFGNIANRTAVTLTNCSNGGAVTATYNNSTVSKNAYAGGIAGYIYNQNETIYGETIITKITLINCVNGGAVEADSVSDKSFHGGIAGCVGGSALNNVTNCAYPSGMDALGDNSYGGDKTVSGAYARGDAASLVVAVYAEIAPKSIAPGETATITFTTMPANIADAVAVNKDSLQSSDENSATATLNDDGTITVKGVSAGTSATISFSANLSVTNFANEGTIQKEVSFTIPVTVTAIQSDPTDPDNPTDPDDPSDPTDPDDPSDPNDPTDPDDPNNPDDPSQPTDPGNSGGGGGGGCSAGFGALALLAIAPLALKRRK